MESVQVGRFPRHAPVHVLSFQPAPGVAVSRRGAYDATADEHRPGHATARPELTILPLPETRTLTL
jgi:hypothetical protein